MPCLASVGIIYSFPFVKCMSLALSWRRLAHESQGQFPEGTQPEQDRHKKLVGTGRCFFVATGPYFTLCTVQSSEPGHATFRRGHDRMDSAARGRYFQPCEMFPAGHRDTYAHAHFGGIFDRRAQEVRMYWTCRPGPIFSNQAPSP